MCFQSYNIALSDPNCMRISTVCVIFVSFWTFAQKSPGGHEFAARQHIKFNPVSGFCHELPGGEICWLSLFHSIFVYFIMCSSSNELLCLCDCEMP